MVRRRQRERGFTLIEMLVVATILGILSGMVAVRYKHTMQRARENRLKHDLRTLRDLIQQYKVDKRVYPDSLDSLAEEEYLRAVPGDAITGSSTTWIEITEEPDPEAEEPEIEEPGIVDVLSGAPGVDLDGIPYEEY